MLLALDNAQTLKKLNYRFETGFHSQFCNLGTSPRDYKTFENVLHSQIRAPCSNLSTFSENRDYKIT
jgi:hypothetical protein